MEFTELDIRFLTELGFIEDGFDEEDLEDGEEVWISYYRDCRDHPFIDDLYLSVGVEPGFISAYGKDGEAFLEKPFTHGNLLAIMEFLRLPIPTDHELQ